VVSSVSKASTDQVIARRVRAARCPASGWSWRERRDRAGRFGAPEDPLAPHHHHRSVPERCVAQQVLAASVGHCDHTAGSASLDLPGGFDEQVQLTAELARGEHPHAGNTEHHCCRTTATIATVHVTGAFIRSATWSLRIMKVPALTSPELRYLGASPNHPQRRRAGLTATIGLQRLAHAPKEPKDPYVTIVGARELAALVSADRSLSGRTDFAMFVMLGVGTEIG